MPPSIAAFKFFDAASELLPNLYARWENERLYEDIKDYQKPFEPLAKVHGVKILKMTKRPFGLQFFVGQRTYAMTFNLRGRYTEYKRIA